ncbi:NAD(P)-dependent oxidoreductase [Streptomyces sp. A7024]|uniref:NAD(P)-dependent oxidoreductase n=1 Tax=Streptomyces coryli TaxID=1128680 RepID=A0A6G4U0Y0_9ACTN|nr:NAD(P)-dependent oxidoreductase [Streptomyces coryli]NGN64937.1 NAD(P)-dependent oxidoreductase [Streptomyces coryli]
MKMLVTGATGRVGSRAVPRLLQWANGPDDEVRVLVRTAEKGEPAAALGAVPVVGDLRDAEARRKALAGVDAVVHTAVAFRGVPDEEAYAVNRDATLGLARDAVAEGVGRFLFTSTTLVYGPGRGRPATEADEPRAGGVLDGAYPQSKRDAERELRELAAADGLDLRIARLGFVYGDGDPHLPEAARQAMDWPAHQGLHCVHHADVARALWRILRSADAAGGTYNVVDDAPLSAAEILELNGTALPDGMADRGLADPWWQVMSNRRLRDELGFRPLYPTVWTARDAGAL